MIAPEERAGGECSFSLGQVVATANAARTLTQSDMLTALSRHANGDWGLVDNDDWVANERALVEGTRLLSVYESEQGVRFWIITEADRSATTVLLPEVY